jgi:hypothetical protein
MRALTPCGRYTSAGGLLAAKNFHGIPIPPATGHSSLARPPTRPNPEAHGCRTTKECLENQVVFDVQPLYQQTVSTVGLLFPDFFKESSRVSLSSKEARQVQRTLAFTSIPFSEKVVAPPLGNFRSGFSVFRPDGGQRNGKSGRS